jgi:hypothetical protein
VLSSKLGKTVPGTGGLASPTECNFGEFTKGFNARSSPGPWRAFERGSLSPSSRTRMTYMQVKLSQE